MTNSTEDQEAEYYKMMPQEHVYTTCSGQKVYSTLHLVVLILDNNEDAAKLATFDAMHGEDCMDSLSECSHTCESNTDTVDGEEEWVEDHGVPYKELPSDTDPEDDNHIICDSDSDSSEVEIEEEDEGGTDEEEESDDEDDGED